MSSLLCPHLTSRPFFLFVSGVLEPSALSDLGWPTVHTGVQATSLDLTLHPVAELLLTPGFFSFSELPSG